MAIGDAIAEDIGSIGRSQQAIAEARTRMTGREHDVRKEVEAQLSEVQKEVSSLRSRLDALAFDLAGAQIKSPAEFGVVMGLAIHTVGGGGRGGQRDDGDRARQRVPQGRGPGAAAPDRQGQTPAPWLTCCSRR